MYSYAWVDKNKYGAEFFDKCQNDDAKDILK